MYEYLDRRYSLALYDIAEEKGMVEEYIKQLKEVIELIQGNEELLQLVKHPQISTSKKKRVFRGIFKGKIDEEILSFLLILIEKNRILYLKEKVKQMELIYLERHNVLKAKVKTVVPLKEEEKKELVSRLERKFNKKIMLIEKIDKSIIGGVYLRVGNDVIDGTIKSKFEEIRKNVVAKQSQYEEKR